MVIWNKWFAINSCKLLTVKFMITSTPASLHILQTVCSEHQHHYMLMVFILASQEIQATQAIHAAVIQHTSAHTYYLNHYRQWDSLSINHKRGYFMTSDSDERRRLLLLIMSQAYNGGNICTLCFHFLIFFNSFTPPCLFDSWFYK